MLDIQKGQRRTDDHPGEYISGTKQDAIERLKVLKMNSLLPLETAN